MPRLPTPQEIGMYDQNGDGVLDQRDVQLARQIGQNTIANAIEKIIGGETVTAADMAGAVGEATDAPTGAELTEKIEESLTPGYVQPSTPSPPPPLENLITNALPSLPSISNVGSAPFTGVVNWNAIPGGFQPLPQTAGGRKKLYQLSQFHGGINKRFSPRDISDQECQVAKNITLSNVGRIKLLGDCLNVNNSNGTNAGTYGFPFNSLRLSSAANLPGYGLFEFTAPVDQDGTTLGETVILVTADGDQVDVTGAYAGSDSGWIDMAGTFTDATCDYNAGGTADPTIAHDDDDGKIAVGMSVSGSLIPAGAYVASVTSDTVFELSASTDAGSAVTNGTLTFSADNGDVAQVYYAAGSGLYVADASPRNFQLNFNEPKARMYIYRGDINGTVGVTGWSSATGKRLIDSPFYNSSNSAGKVSKVASASVATANGSMNVLIEDVAGDGTWAGTYHFYVSWLFDGGTETGLTPMGDDDGFDADGERLEFNLSIVHTNAAPLGADRRIEGARVYFKGDGENERFLLAEMSLMDGIKGALDSTFTPWRRPGSDRYDLAADIEFANPPEVYTYASINGYYANEVYDESPDATSDALGPESLSLNYKTAVVGSGGIVFIGNVKFDGKHMADSMMFSMPGKPGVFPRYNRFDSPSSDGSPIKALAAFKDTILQFKQNGMYVINVSNPAQFYAQASFRDCGVSNPCQVFTTSFGVIFANKHGCFIYDGQKVISLTGGKFNNSDWGIAEGPVNTTTADFPSVGYDPRSQNIIVLKNIGDDATDADGWVYNMATQSWTEAIGIIENADNRRYTNFIISSDGYLSIKANTDVGGSNTGQNLLNYNHDKLVDTGAQTITYWTKDLDF